MARAATRAWGGASTPRVRRLLAAALVAAALWLVVTSEVAGRADQRLLDTAPRRVAVVERVLGPAHRDGSTRVVLDLDGRQVRADVRLPGGAAPQPGTRVLLAQDPSDPAHVLPVGAHDGLGWAWWARLGTDLAWLLAAVVVAAALLPSQARRAPARARSRPEG